MPKVTPAEIRARAENRENGQETKHTYPSNYPPGTHWATDEAWKILDCLKPGVIPPDVRAYLAGYIAGLIMRINSQNQKPDQ